MCVCVCVCYIPVYIYIIIIELLARISLALSDIYRCVPPTHEYGTRPFLRWVRSQGRSPHASSKAKNTFGPVGILLFGAPQASGNKPNPPKGVKAWGDGPLSPEEISSAEAHPAEPPRGKTAYRKQPNNRREKVTNTLLSSVLVIHRFRKAFQTTPCVCTEML